jgi:capsid protein
VIESEGYDAEEVDRRIAADRAREQELGLSFGTKSPKQSEPIEEADPDESAEPSSTPANQENAA